jgi:hypothetical protein
MGLEITKLGIKRLLLNIFTFKPRQTTDTEPPSVPPEIADEIRLLAPRVEESIETRTPPKRAILNLGRMIGQHARRAAHDVSRTTEPSAAALTKHAFPCIELFMHESFGSASEAILDDFPAATSAPDSQEAQTAQTAREVFTDMLDASLPADGIEETEVDWAIAQTAANMMLRATVLVGANENL